MGKNYIITETQYSKLVDKFITYQFEPHQVTTSKMYPDSKFWVKNGHDIAEVKTEKQKYFWSAPKVKSFWCHEDIWKNISNMFSVDVLETQSMIQNWLKTHYNFNIKPSIYDVNSSIGWDNNF